MITPRQLRSAADQQEDMTIDHRAYEDGSVIVIDFGPDVEVSVDIVGETAIVIAGDQQYEFEVPAEASEVTANDGVLLIEE